MVAKTRCLFIAGLVAICMLQQRAFVPPATHLAKPKAELSVATSAACAAAIMDGTMRVPAHADVIDDAAHTLAQRAYPFLKEIPWDSDMFARYPHATPFTNMELLKSLNKLFLMGAAMDKNALRKGVLVHSKAIQSIDSKGACTLADFESICSSLGHMIASVPASLTMDAYNAFIPLAWEKEEVPQFLVNLVNPSDAKEAYSAFMTFKDVVQAYQQASR